MRKLIALVMVTLDDYYEGPDQDCDWRKVDDDYLRFTLDPLLDIDTAVFARITYLLQMRYWSQADPHLQSTQKMNRLHKIVFSTTMEHRELGENTTLVKTHPGREIERLKQLPGKNIAIFGSRNLVTYFTLQGLIDEYRVLVCPVIIGQAIPVCRGLSYRPELQIKSYCTTDYRGSLLIYNPLRMQNTPPIEAGMAVEATKDIEFAKAIL